VSVCMHVSIRACVCTCMRWNPSVWAVMQK
jgi:hypothetical protein